MFKALVTICMIGFPNDCQVLEDQLGPYETESACKDRVLDISRQVHKYYPLWKPSRYRCQELPPGRLKYEIGEYVWLNMKF